LGFTALPMTHLERENMIEKPIFSTVAFALMLSSGLAKAVPQSSAIDLAPHLAIYDMSLHNATAGSNISDVRGRLVFDFAGSACAGYTLKSRLVTKVVDREGNATVTDLRSSTFENHAGDRFRFENKQYIGRQLSEQVAGLAERHEKGDEIEVDLDLPKESQLKFDGKVLFPTQHSIAILDAALRGAKVLQADIYDGSEQGNKLFQTTTFIGRQIEPGTGNRLSVIANADRLDQLISWPISISYFEIFRNPAQDQGLPTYELSFRLFANGVSRDLLINYGDILIHGELTRLDFHEPASCADVKN
jgi:hypothetical protein